MDEVSIIDLFQASDLVETVIDDLEHRGKDTLLAELRHAQELLDKAQRKLVEEKGT